VKLKSMGLTNFRGFDRLEIDFEPDMTVIAGINGAGKSSILEAIAIAYSHALPEFTASREKPRSITDADIQQGSSSCSIELETTELLAATLITWLFKESLGKTDRASVEDRLAYLKKALLEVEKGTPEYKNLKNQIAWSEKRLQGNFEKRSNWLFTDAHGSDARTRGHLKSSPGQPLVIYYSTRRFLSRMPPRLAGVAPFKQAAAYKNSLDQLEVSLSEFAKWHRALLSARIVRKDSQHREKILKSLVDAVTNLLPDVKEFYFHQNASPPRYSVIKYATLQEKMRGDAFGKELSLEQLSDGERGLIALVFDLTRRLAIANPDSANPIAEGVALVLIDEIELHLHPRWQRDVVKILPEIFKNTQFIITTHSPQVIGETEARSVRLLSMLGNTITCEIPSVAHGADSNWILSVLMGADEMSEDIESEIKKMGLRELVWVNPTRITALGADT
jgi:predicted ATP-binding protein involved in virulence